jgi:regulator of sigma E protease
MSSFLSGAWPWVLTIAGFMALIIIHELGHFFAAKKTGMRVEQLSLFFGPKVVRIPRGETEYCIGTIPAGGYAKITGMNPEEELPPDVAPRAFYRQPVWKRIVVIGAGPAANVALAFILLFFLAFSAAKINDTVGDTLNGSPAAAQLQKGDRVLAVDGRSFPDASTETRLLRFRNLVGKHECAGKPTDGCTAKTPVHLRIERGGQIRTIAIRPEYDAEVRRTRLGFTYGSTPLDPSIPGAAGMAASDMWRVTTGTVGVFGRLFDAEQRKKVHGIVGISDVTHQAIEFGLAESLYLIALISLSLAIINLFPFLPLDGGHIFWSLVEKVRGKAVPFRVMEATGVVGFLLVIMLATIGLTNDINTLSSGGFNVR